MKLKSLWGFLLAACTLCMLAASCADDDSFTTSTQNRLSFSVDTVKLDTVFSRVPTPTKSLWVYNHSGDGIRCSNIRLARGNQTGYRVNVDGTYLGESSGWQTQNVEIRDKDSIRVFVELTSPANGLLTPQPLDDDLIFLLESGTEQRVHLSAYTWDAEIVNGLRVSADTTLQSSRPLIVYGGIVVDSTATLRIPAGQTVYFHAGAGIDVYGRLLCEGQPDNNVVLRGDRIDNMFDYLPYDLVSGQWSGIRIHSSSYENNISYTDIHSTFNGIVCDSADVSRLKLDLLYSTVHNCQGDGLQANNCYVRVANCQITNTLGNCVGVVGGNVLLQHCTLAQFYPFDAMRGAALHFTNGPGSPLQLVCLNSLITGYADDVVMGTQADTAAVFDYYFSSSVMRTPAVDDTLRFKNILWEDPEDTLTTGRKHFRLVNGDTQHYDFHLDSLSTAINRGDPLNALPEDRDGRQRDEQPDAGCFEFIPSSSTTP